MAEVLTAMAVATFIKGMIEVWERIEQSFARVLQNRRVAQRLVCDIGEDLNTLKELYEENHATLDRSGKTETAIKSLIKKMDRALQTSSELLPPKSEKRFGKYRLKYYAWKNGTRIEEELRDLRSYVNNCYQSFNTLAMARVEIQGIEQRQITVTRTDVIQNMLSDLTVSANRLRAYHPAQSGISPSIVIDIPDEYLKIILSTISDAMHREMFTDPSLFISYLLRTTFRDSDDDPFPPDRESLHRDTVAFALYTHRYIKNILTGSKIDHRISRLSRMSRCLGMSQEADGIDLIKVVARTIIDIPRPNIHRLAHADGESVVSSLNSEVLQHLDVLDHKVDLLLQFFEHQSDAVDESDALREQIGMAYCGIWSFYWWHKDSIPNIEEIQEEIDSLRSCARRIHKLDKSLPLLDI